jgi:NaMN:DMB phosphoribosyltransferase
VSSSLPDNPLARKEAVVEAALDASDLAPGEAAHHPELAVRFVGDPTLAVVAGLCAGALESGTRVTLAGGTQLVAAAALVRHAGCVRPLTLATTAYLADHVDLASAVRDLDLDLVVTDPDFADERLAQYATVGREGAAMGGALALADGAGVLDEVEGRTLALLDDLAANAERDTDDAGVVGDATDADGADGAGGAQSDGDREGDRGS